MKNKLLEKEIKKYSKKKNSTIHLLETAEKLGIQYKLILREEEEFYFRLSHKNKTIYLLNAFIHRHLDLKTATLVDNKELAKIVLSNNKIKTPQGFTVQKFSEIKTGLIKHKITFPLVIKPEYSICGQGVTANIKNWTELKKAYQKTKKIRVAASAKRVIIEEYFSGNDYRVLVFKNKVIACAERVRPNVIGDGQHTLKQLIKKQLKTKGPDALVIDWEVERNLKMQDVKMDSVIAIGRKIQIRENSNLSTGGYSVDRTSEICPKFKKIAIESAKSFNMKFAGIDILTSDISNPKSDYRILELNHNAGYYTVHIKPKIGKSINVAEFLLKDVFNIK